MRKAVTEQRLRAIVRLSENIQTLSPEYNAGTNNPGPEVFDGNRFARLREIPGRESKHQTVTTGLV